MYDLRRFYFLFYFVVVIKTRKFYNVLQRDLQEKKPFLKETSEAKKFVVNNFFKKLRIHKILHKIPVTGLKILTSHNSVIFSIKKR